MFDKRKEFKKDVLPLLDEAVKQATLIGVPMIFSAAVKDDDKTTEYMNGMVSANDLQVTLADNQIIEHANVINGLKTSIIPPHAIDDSFMMDEDDYLEEVVEEIIEEIPEEKKPEKKKAAPRKRTKKPTDSKK